MEPTSLSICVFVNDKLTDPVIQVLSGKGVKVIVLHCAGFNNVKLETAKQPSLRVSRVPVSSHEAVAPAAHFYLVVLKDLLMSSPILILLLSHCSAS